MKRLLSVLAVGIVTLAAVYVTADADSIYARGNRRTQSLFTDDIARDVSDVLTIVIEESSVIENETTRNMSKDSSRSYEMSGSTNLLKGLNAITADLFNLPNLDLTTSSETDFEGTADYDSDRSVEDKITVVVEDVLPNGNLVVLGQVMRRIHGDTQMVKVSGIVRPSDINYENEVSSNKIANFRLVYISRGRENQFTKPGWLDEILNFLNPF